MNARTYPESVDELRITRKEPGNQSDLKDAPRWLAATAGVASLHPSLDEVSRGHRLGWLEGGEAQLGSSS